MRVAYYSPLPPEPSGVSDYSALLVPALRTRIDLRVVSPKHRRPPRADLHLYHVGNEAGAHGWIVDALRRRPGVVVLHEFVLHHLVVGLTLGRGDRHGYLDAMEREAGIIGRLLAHGVADGLLPPMSELYPNELPLTSWVLVDAEGVIVHSRYVEERVRETGYPGPVWRIPMASWPSVPHGAPPGLPTGRFPVIGCFGFLNSTKRIPQLLEGFAIVRQRVPDALLVLAGGLAPGLDLEQHLELLGLKRGVDVICLDRVSEHRLWGLIRACDVCVALRAPTMGETSAMAVRILAAGRPLVTSNLGWFAELPDEVTAKIPVDEQEVDVLAATLERLARQPELRKRMGAAALEHVRREHGLDDVAELYAAALGELRAG